MNRNRWDINLRTSVAPFAGAAIVLLFGILTLASTRREDEATRSVAHTEQVVGENDATLALLVDAEAGERGYLISDDTAYLVPYRRAAANVFGHVSALRALTAGNSAQHARVDTLEGLVGRRLAALQHRILTRRAKGLHGARAEFVALSGGTYLMDSVRHVTASIDSAERDLFRVRSAKQRLDRSAVVGIVIVGTVVAALVGVLINFMFLRSAETQRRLAEDLEDRTREAEEANRTKAQFLASVSHDLRTPLNAILGYAALLEVHGPLSDEQREDIRRMTRSSKHLLAMMEDLLDFARIEQGRLRLQPTDIPLSVLLDDLRSLVEPQARAKGLALVFDCDSPLVAHADHDKVQEILVNLVGNATKFTNSGGRLEIHCASDDDDRVRVDVSDTGEGIPEESLSQIFEPFVQLERRLGKPERHSAGLGLAISRKLARAMEGDLTVVSEVGVGSTFSLHLPRERSTHGAMVEHSHGAEERDEV